MIIAVDFDGTCVKHRYPMVGEDVDGAVSVLKELVKYETIYIKRVHKDSGI